MTSWFMSSQNFSEQKSFKSIKPSSFQDFFCSVEINEASSLIMDAKNPGAVSWLANPITDSVGFTDEKRYKDCVMVYAMNKAASLPRYEIGYEII